MPAMEVCFGTSGFLREPCLISLSTLGEGFVGVICFSSSCGFPQCLIDILLDILDILQADRKPDIIFGNPCLLLLFPG